MLLILGVVIEFIVLPQLAGARRSWHLITDVRPWFLILGVLLEFASLACYAELTRSLLPPAERPRRWTIQRIDMSTLAVSHLVPGGGAAGTAVAFQLFNGAGVPAQAAGFAVATQGIGSAAANWTLDAASLWVFLYAFGFRAGPIELVVAYGLANVLAAIPVTPGGLGIVEGVLVPTLVGFGASRGIAILGVVAWRLVNFWLPIPVGTACYVSLRAGAHASRRARREAVEGLVGAAEAGSRRGRSAS